MQTLFYLRHSFSPYISAYVLVLAGIVAGNSTVHDLNDSGRTTVIAYMCTMSAILAAEVVSVCTLGVSTPKAPSFNYFVRLELYKQCSASKALNAFKMTTTTLGLVGAAYALAESETGQSLEGICVFVFLALHCINQYFNRVMYTTIAHPDMCLKNNFYVSGSPIDSPEIILYKVQNVIDTNLEELPHIMELRNHPAFRHIDFKIANDVLRAGPAVIAELRDVFRVTKPAVVLTDSLPPRGINVLVNPSAVVVHGVSSS